MRRAIGVRIGDDQPGGSLQTHVAGGPQALVLLADRAHAGKPRGNRRRVVARSVVDEDHFVVRVVQRGQGLQALRQGRAAVVGTDHHGNPQRAGQQVDGVLGVGRAEGVIRCLWRAVGPRDAEGPVDDGVPPGEPFIGPREDERSGKAGVGHLAEVASQKFRLPLLAVAERVHAHFAQHQRLVADQVHQPHEVAAKGLPVVEIDVKGREIEKREIEILGRWIVVVGHQAVRVGLLSHVGQLPQEAFDPLGPMPANDIGGDFIADAAGQHGWRLAALLHPAADSGPRVAAGPGTVQETKMLRPGDADHHAQIVLPRQVEQLGRGHVIDPQGVDADGLHLGEIAGRHLHFGKRLPLMVGREWSVGHATQMKSPPAARQESTVHRQRQ